MASILRQLIHQNMFGMDVLNITLTPSWYCYTMDLCPCDDTGQLFRETTSEWCRVPNIMKTLAL